MPRADWPKDGVDTAQPDDKAACRLSRNVPGRLHGAGVQTLPDFDEHVARQFVGVLVQSSIAGGVDPVARLQQFCTLQQAAAVLVRDPVVAQALEQLVQSIDVNLQELAPVKS